MKKHIIVLLLIVCTVLTLAACRKEPASAYDLSGVVELRYLDIDSVCENDALSEAGEQLLGAVREDILLSFVADSSIEITKEELSGYDHLVFINSAWAERFCSSSELQELEYGSLPAGMQAFLAVQMPLFTKDGSVQPDGIRFYEYSGSGLLSFPFMVGQLAPAVVAENPLVVMIDDPVSTMDAGSFLLPLSSSGNLVFSNEKTLQKEIKNSPLAPYISDVKSMEGVSKP